jgi:hypothetical protein
VNGNEKKLHFTLIRLTNGFTQMDFFAYRKERNWKKYDEATPEERLLMIMREISIYKKGYIEDHESNDRDYGDSTDEIY